MTRSETIAFNRGVRLALHMARQSAVELRGSPDYRTTRTEFAVAALDEFAAAGELMLLPVPESEEAAEHERA